jgi:hypothetical protein
LGTAEGGITPALGKVIRTVRVMFPVLARNVGLACGSLRDKPGMAQRLAPKRKKLESSYLILDLFSFLPYHLSAVDESLRQAEQAIVSGEILGRQAQGNIT